MLSQSKEQIPLYLSNMANRLRECQPEDHRIAYRNEAWRRCFPGDNDLIEIHERFGDSISRGDVAALGVAAESDPGCVRRFAMAVMMWGYGTVGYGATRTSEMLANPQSIVRLIGGADLVKAGDFTEACLFYRNNSRGALKKFGWSFFTKYFYFVGLACGLDPMPLILDGNNRTTGVAGGMKQLADAGDPKAARAMELWWSSTDRRCAEGYTLYVELVNQWAHDLTCRPDAIEMALWNGVDL